MLGSKENIFRLAHRVGLWNNVIIVVVFFSACAFAGFQCRGPTMDTIMSQYIFWVFIPQVVIGIIALLGIIMVVAASIPNDIEKQDIRRLVIYLISLILVIGVFSI